MNKPTNKENSFANDSIRVRTHGEYLVVGIIFIGDRNAGKTHLVLELTNPVNQHVLVDNLDYENLKKILSDTKTGEIDATDANKEVDHRSLNIQVKLPAGKRSITVDWIDTPGEIWRSSWQGEHPDKWRNFLTTIRQVRCVILILSPYREMLLPGTDETEFSTKEQWIFRFERWVKFFQQDCPNVKHIAICLNKADLFCNYQQESSKLKYSPAISRMNWHHRHTYIYDQYFIPVHEQIAKINRSIRGLATRCFITTIHDRSLLELPWIYLASHLAS